MLCSPSVLELTSVVHKAAWLSSNGEELLEDVAVKYTTRLLRGVVGHEVL
jgi:hypothetical protein